MNFLQVGKLVLEIVPLTIKFVEAINEAIPEAKKGKEKLELLKGVIEETLVVAEDIADDVKDSVLKIVEKFVGLYVAVKKKIHGVF